MNQPIQSVQVSCIIPVYNAEQFLAETIESVLAQTHAVDEILFVDDGSIDTTKTIIDSYVEKHPTQIRYFRQERGGPGAARNRGILAARGEFISFLDGDDLWHKEKTARQLHRFMERPELGISVTHIQNFWLDNLHNQEAGIQEHPRAKAMAGYVPPAAMVRRAIFERVGLFNVNLRFAEIIDWFRRAHQAKVVDELLPDVLVYRRLHSDSYSHSNGDASRSEFLQLMHTWRKQELGAANRDSNSQ